MSSGWTLVGDLVKLIDETDTVRVGPDPTPPSPLPKLEVVGNALMTLQDKGGNVFDVRAYGAKGDGLTDDLPAIDKAVMDLRRARGGTLYFPPGRYVVSGEILIDGWNPLPAPGELIPFLVRGAGPGAAMLISSSATANTIRTVFGGAQAIGRELYMEIRDLMFGVAVGVTKTAGDAIRQECAPAFQNTFVVRNCWFRDTYNCVHLTSWGSAMVEGCQFTNPRNAAVFLEQTVPPSSDVGAVFISNNLFFRKPTTGTGVYAVYATTGCTGVRIDHCAFVQFDHQVFLQMVPTGLHTAIDIDSNILDGGSAYPKIHITGDGEMHRVTISNNHIVVIGSAGPIAGIQVETTLSGGLHHCVISGNVIDGNPAHPVGTGIVLNPSVLGGCRDLLITGNLFGDLTTGIQVGPLCQRIFLGENVFEGTVTTPVVDNGDQPRGAFFPDRVGIGRPNDVSDSGASTKDLYLYSNAAVRPRIYLQGAPGVSAPGIDFAFDNTNVQRGGIVATAVGSGVQLELFTKPNSGSGIAQRAILDPDGNLVWTVPNFTEMIDRGGDPAAPASTKARLFVKHNIAGKAQLCVRFASGAAVVLATEP